jgi:hypothetical protein
MDVEKRLNKNNLINKEIKLRMNLKNYKVEAVNFS